MHNDPMYSNSFRVLKDNSRENVFRIVHLQQVDGERTETFANVLEEDGKFFKATWIRNTDGSVSEFETKQEVDRAVNDLCNTIDFDNFTKACDDIPVVESCHGLKRAVISEEASS